MKIIFLLVCVSFALVSCDEKPELPLPAKPASDNIKHVSDSIPVKPTHTTENLKTSDSPFPTTPNEKVTTEDHKFTTPEKPTEKTSTVKPTEKTSTVKPTEKTSTVKPTEKTSTVKPPEKTSTTENPTTENPTTVTPPSHFGDWSISDTKNNKTCIRLKGSIELQVPYNKIDTKTKNSVMVNDTVKIPSSAMASGSCDEENITLTWGVSGDLSHVTLIFHKNKTEETYMISQITADIIPKDFPDIAPEMKNVTILLKAENLNLFSTPLNKSYLCVKESSLPLIAKNPSNTGAIQFTNLQLQAYKTTNGIGFDDAENCENGGGTPDIVPIAVGCTLALLIIVVLVSYLISRRRSQSRGYLSM